MVPNPAFWTPEKVCFWFLKKIPPNFLGGRIFEYTPKQVIDCQKRHFGRFWQLITVFVCVFKNTDENNICGFIVFKAKIKEKHKEIFFVTVFILKLKNALFWGVNQFFYSVLAFKTIDTKMLFWSVFLETNKKTVINSQNGVFECQ